MNSKIFKHLFFLFIISSLSIYTSCSGEPEKGPPPSAKVRLSFAFTTFPVTRGTGSCIPRNVNTGALLDINEEFVKAVTARQLNAIGKSGDKDRWIPELSVAGELDNGKGGWKVDLKSSDVKAISVGTVLGGLRRVVLSYDVPKPASGKLAIIPKLLTPCITTANCNVCTSQASKRIFFEDGTVAVEDLQPGIIFEFVVRESPVSGNTPIFCKSCQ